MSEIPNRPEKTNENRTPENKSKEVSPETQKMTGKLHEVKAAKESSTENMEPASGQRNRRPVEKTEPEPGSETPTKRKATGEDQGKELGLETPWDKGFGR